MGSQVMTGWLKSNDSEVPLIEQARDGLPLSPHNCGGNYQSGPRHEPATRAIADSPSTAAGSVLRASQHQGLPLIERVPTYQTDPASWGSRPLIDKGQIT